MDITLNTTHASIDMTVATIANSDVCKFLEKILAGTFTPEDEEHLQSQKYDTKAQSVVSIARSVRYLQPFTLIKVCGHIMKENNLPDDYNYHKQRVELAAVKTVVQTLKDSGVTFEYSLNIDVERSIKEYNDSNIFLEKYYDILNQLTYLEKEIEAPEDMTQLNQEITQLYSTVVQAVENALEHPSIQCHVIAKRLFTITIKPQVEDFLPTVEAFIKDSYRDAITEILYVLQEPRLTDECIESLREVHMTLHRDEADFGTTFVDILSNRIERSALRDLLHGISRQPQLLRQHYSESSIANSLLFVENSPINPLFDSREVFMKFLRKPDYTKTPPPEDPPGRSSAPSAKRARFED